MRSTDRQSFSPPSLAHCLAVLDHLSARPGETGHLAAGELERVAEGSDFQIASVDPHLGQWLTPMGHPRNASHQQALQQVFWPELTWPNRPTSPVARKAMRTQLRHLVRGGVFAKPPVNTDYLRPDGWQEPPRPRWPDGRWELVKFTAVCGVALGLTYLHGLALSACVGALSVGGLLGAYYQNRWHQRWCERNRPLLAGAQDDWAHHAAITPRRNERARWDQHPALATYAAACETSPVGFLEGDRVRLNAAWDRWRHGGEPALAVPERRYEHRYISRCITIPRPFRGGSAH